MAFLGHIYFLLIYALFRSIITNIVHIVYNAIPLALRGKAIALPTTKLCFVFKEHQKILAP